MQLRAHRWQLFGVLRFTNLYVLGSRFLHGRASGGPPVSSAFSRFLGFAGLSFLLKIYRRVLRVS